MIEVTNEEFEKIVAAAMDAIPKQYTDHMKNVGFVIEDLPTEQQRQKLHLYKGQTLYGLYEGIPLTQRNAGYNLVLPDKITIFKKPLEASSFTLGELSERVKYTVWHEVAHHFGLSHE